MAVDADALLNRVNDLFHEVDLLKLGLAELNLRLESVLALCRVDLARFEDIIRIEDVRRAEYEFQPGNQEDGDDLIGS